jgi:hypothetical protein
MSHLNTATPVVPVVPVVPVATAAPVVGAVPVATATTVLPHNLGAHEHGHHAHGHHGHHGHEHGHTGLPIVGGGAPIVHGATNVIQHQPIVEREVVVERPVEVRREHHIQPVIHEREHQIQPVIRTEVTTERRDIIAERDVMLPAVVEQPHIVHGTTGAMAGTGTGAHHASIGQKIKGTVKEVQGALTHNPAKKEEGRLLKQGIDPTTAGLGTTTGATHNATHL